MVVTAFETRLLGRESDPITGFSSELGICATSQPRQLAATIAVRVSD
jgi:hypothetical protein